MPSDYASLFRELAAPFTSNEVKLKPISGGKQAQYVSARVVMNRLDSVLGPENWRDEYLMGEHSVLCKLSVRLPDGEWLTKCDAGAYAGMADDGDDDKSGVSDAFKRAAVKFGPGRYLYKDGVAHIEQSVEEKASALAAKYAEVPQATRPPGREPKDPVRPITNGKDLYAYINSEEAAQERAIRDEVGIWLKANPQFQLPRKFSLWTDEDVRKHLPAMMAIVKKLDAVSDVSSSDRTTKPIAEAPKPAARTAPAAGPPAHDPTEIADSDPFCELKRAIVDATGNLLFAQFGKAATCKDVMQMIDWLAWEISHPKGDDIVIGDLSKFVEPEHIKGNMAGFLRALLGRAEEERKQIIEANRQNFG